MSAGAEQDADYMRMVHDVSCGASRGQAWNSHLVSQQQKMHSHSCKCRLRTPSRTKVAGYSQEAPLTKVCELVGPDKMFKLPSIAAS